MQNNKLWQHQPGLAAAEQQLTVVVQHLIDQHKGFTTDHGRRALETPHDLCVEVLEDISQKQIKLYPQML